MNKHFSTLIITLFVLDLFLSLYYDVLSDRFLIHFLSSYTHLDMIAAIKSIVCLKPLKTSGSEILCTVSEKVFFTLSFTLYGRNVVSFLNSSESALASSGVEKPYDRGQVRVIDVS